MNSWSPPGKPKLNPSTVFLPSVNLILPVAQAIQQNYLYLLHFKPMCNPSATSPGSTSTISPESHHFSSPPQPLPSAKPPSAPAKMSATVTDPCPSQPAVYSSHVVLNSLLKYKVDPATPPAQTLRASHLMEKSTPQKLERFHITDSVNSNNRNNP